MEINYKQIVENVRSIIICISNKFEILEFNREAERIYGYKRQEVIGKDYLNLFIPEEHHDNITKDIKKVLSREDSINYINPIISKSGKEYIIRWNVSPLENARKETYGIIAVGENITDRVKEKQKLIKEMKKANEYLNIASVMILALDIDGNIKLLNRRGHDILQYEEGEIIGKNWFTLCLPEQNREELSEVFNKLMDGKVEMGEKYENPILTKNGDIKTLLWNNTLLYDDDGNISGTLSSGEDITERKLAEKKIKDEKEIFENISQTSPIGIVMLDKNGIINFANNQAEEVLGLSKNEITQRSYNASSWKITHYDLSPYPDEELPFHKVKIHKKPFYNIKHAIQKQNGELIFLSINATPLLTDEGEFNGMIASLDDVTNQIAAQQTIKESEKKFRSIVASTPMGIHMYKLGDDGSLRFIGANKSADRILGVDNSIFIGKTIEEAFPPLIESEVPDSYRKAAQDGISYFSEQIIYEDQQISGAYEVNAFQTSPGYVVALFMDITERKQAEMKIKESEINFKEAFNRAEFYKDLFAHDINNILQNISMAVQLNLKKLKEINIKGKFEEINHIIKEQVHRGAKLVSNIRKLSQIEEERTPLENIEVISILNNSVAYIEKSYRHKSLNIKINSENDEFFVLANEFIQEIFDNILINAVKYTKHKEIEIIARISRELLNEKQYVKFEFIDNGIGIHDSLKEKVFQRSYSEANSKSGLGLGLSLVKKIIESYQGQIRVENKIKGEYTKGSNFIVLIPELIQTPELSSIGY